MGGSSQKALPTASTNARPRTSRLFPAGVPNPTHLPHIQAQKLNTMPYVSTFSSRSFGSAVSVSLTAIRNSRKPVDFLKISIHVPGFGIRSSSDGTMTITAYGIAIPTPIRTMATLLTSRGCVWAQTSTNPSSAPLQGVLRTPAKKPIPAVPASPEPEPCLPASEEGSERGITSSMASPKSVMARNSTITALG